MVTDQPRLVGEADEVAKRRTERTLAGAAAKAGLDEKTARKYWKLGRPPSQCKKPRTWCTRVNVFLRKYG